MSWEQTENSFGFKSGICLLIAPVPVHCFSITFHRIEQGGVVSLEKYNSIEMSIKQTIKYVLIININTVKIH